MSKVSNSNSRGSYLECQTFHQKAPKRKKNWDFEKNSRQFRVSSLIYSLYSQLFVVFSVHITYAPTRDAKTFCFLLFPNKGVFSGFFLFNECSFSYSTFLVQRYHTTRFLKLKLKLNSYILHFNARFLNSWCCCERFSLFNSYHNIYFSTL